MDINSYKDIKTCYNDRYEKFGYDVRTIGWGSAESQMLRFKVLSDIADLRGKTICDVGCGFGDLYSYLIKRFGHVNYIGFDLSDKLIAEAMTRYPEANFETKDILQDSPDMDIDYVLCSGALNLKINEHEKYVEQMLVRMFELGKRGVAVNFLSSYVDYSLDKDFHFSPESAFKLGKRITNFVSLRHDYPLYEFTLYLYHQDA